MSRVVTCMTLVVGTSRHLGKTRKGGQFYHQDNGMVSVSNLKSKLYRFLICPMLACLVDDLSFLWLHLRKQTDKLLLSRLVISQLSVLDFKLNVQ